MNYSKFLLFLGTVLSVGASSAPNLRNHAKLNKHAALSRHAKYSTEQYKAMGVVRELDTTPDVACIIDGDQKCPITDFNTGDIVQIFPGGDTACMDNDSPFGFVVSRKDPAKVLLYFSGGGACWDELTYSLGLCKTDNSVPDIAGIFNADSSTPSKFSNYTTILVTYCSGDIFLGDQYTDYNDTQNRPMKQAGRPNALSVLSWVKEQMGTDKFFGSELQELMLGGASAGALGSPIWARHFLSEIPAKHSALLVDSFINAIPAVYVGALLQDIGICDDKLLLPTSDYRKSCSDGLLTIEDLIMLSMREHPKTTFAYIQAKWDSIQVLFYNAVLSYFGQPTISVDDYYDATVPIIRTLNEMKNFVIFLVEDDAHTYLNRQAVFKVDVLGPCGGACDRGYITVNDWVSGLPLYDGDSIRSQCGELVNSTGLCYDDITNKVSYFVPDFDSAALTGFQFDRMMFVTQSDRADVNLEACQVLLEETHKKKNARIHFQSGAIYVPEEGGVLTAYFRNMLRKVNMSKKLASVRFVFGNSTFGYEWEQTLAEKTQHFQLLNDDEDVTTFKGSQSAVYFESALQIDIGRLGREMTLIAPGEYHLEVQIVHTDGTINQCVRAEFPYPAGQTV